MAGVLPAEDMDLHPAADHLRVRPVLAQQAGRARLLPRSHLPHLLHHPAGAHLRLLYVHRVPRVAPERAGGGQHQPDHLQVKGQGVEDADRGGDTVCVLLAAAVRSQREDILRC